MTKMPTLFLSHGSPTILIEEHSPARLFQEGLSKQLEKPRAILVISAHWETDHPCVTGTQSPQTIHDFYGFSNELYQMTYSPPGATELAQQVAKLVDGRIDQGRGLDHGAWTPLKLIYPDADIPTLQLSVQPHASALHHYELGRKLTPLRNEGVLIVASGAVTHNLSTLRWFETRPDVWAQEFENWFVKAIATNDHTTLLNVNSDTPGFSMAHPSPEHWLPLYVAMGAARNQATLLHRGFEHRNLSMASVRFD